MSWWWKSTTAPSSKTPEGTATATSPPPSDATTSPTAAALASPEPIKRALNREEQAEQEWASLLRELQADTGAGQTERTTSQQQETAFQTTPTQTDISPHSLYPTEMSCRSSFDYGHVLPKLWRPIRQRLPLRLLPLMFESLGRFLAMYEDQAME